MSKEEHNFSSREDFVESWLSEMPVNIGAIDGTFSYLTLKVKKHSKEQKPTKISNNFFKLDIGLTIYYWYQQGKDITIIAEISKKPQGYSVNLVGKNPLYKNKPPYATDLYQSILADAPQSLLFSDSTLSDDGINLWKKLIADPKNVVSVYDKKNPGQTFKSLSDPNELDNYIGPFDSDHFRFILSDKVESLAEIRSYFNLRRYRELIEKK